MSKKKRKKRFIPCFAFTQETLAITQEAMKLFEQSLQRVESQSAKIAFAEETMKQINGKLETMGMSVGMMHLTTFDYNEKIVIATAIQLYTFDLLATPSDPQRERALQKCRQIACFALHNLEFEPYRSMYS